MKGMAASRERRLWSMKRFDSDKQRGTGRASRYFIERTVKFRSAVLKATALL
jgi:hypothetical protein